MTESQCPYCEQRLEPKPRRKKKCPHCGEYVYVRDGELLTELEKQAFDEGRSPDSLNPLERLSVLCQRYKRRWWLIPVLVFLIGAAVYLISAFNDVADFYDRARNFLPTPRPTPFITPAAEGEYLIIVAEFQDNSAARNLDVRTILASAIADEIPPDLEGRVVVAHGAIPSNETEARTLGWQHNASAIVWGRYTDNLVEVHFDPLAGLDSSAQMHTRSVTCWTVDELAMIVNELAAGPVQWVSVLAIGQVLLFEGRFADAQSYFDRAVTLLEVVQPHSEQAAATFYFRGVINSLQGNSKAAVDDYTEALALQPDSDRADSIYYNRGNGYTDLGELDRAIADYTQLLSLDPKHSCGYYKRGMNYLEQGEGERALADLRMTVDLFPDPCHGHSALGYAYRVLGDFDRAILEYTRSVDLCPDDTSHLTGRAHAYRELGQFHLALADVNRALELDPDDAWSYAARGSVFLSLGQLERAMDDLDRAIALDPELTEAYYNRGAIYHRLGQFEPAMADFDQALTVDPHFAEAHMGRGGIYAEQGLFEQAIADLNKALEINPNLAAAYLNRAAAYGRMGDTDKALADYNRALELASDPEVKALAEEALAAMKE